MKKKNWIFNNEIELPTYSENALSFHLSDKQTEHAKKWMDERRKYVGAIGGQFTYEITPTGLGYVIKITDGEETLDLTDYDLW